MRYESETLGIKVSVQPSFSLAQSDPGDGTYVFSYDVAMRNVSADPARLLFRHWYIHDSAGDDTEVDGEGVIGQQPLLLPGASHEYRSFCVLRSPIGYMEGYYTFADSSGDEFRVAIPRFALEAPLLPPDSDEIVERLN